MSDIDLTFVVDTASSSFTVENTELTFTTNPINMTIATGGIAVPGGNIGEIQFNDASTFNGTPNLTYSSGNLSLIANVADVKITGGTNGYVLQTDGTGNLTWTAQTGGSGGNGVPGGSNTQVQYNNAGTFGGDSTFTFNDITNTLTVANLNVTGGFNISTLANGTANIKIYNNAEIALSSYTDANVLVVGRDSGAPAVFVNGELNSFNQGWYNTGASALLQIGNATIIGDNANIPGNISTSNLSATTSINSSNTIVAVGNISGGNISTTGVISATGNVSGGNISTTGSISGVTISATGNISGGNANLGNAVVANFFIGDGGLLSNISATASNISNGTSSLNIPAVNGNILLSVGGTSNVLVITSTGAIVNGTLGVNSSNIALGNSASTIAYLGVDNGIAIGGNSTSQTTANVNSVAIGWGAKANLTGGTAIGYVAQAGENGLAVGYSVTASNNATVLGRSSTASANTSIAIGFGVNSANAAGVAIGRQSTANGNASLSLGANAKSSFNNTIILNATDANLNSTQASSLFVKPIRNVTAESGFTVQLYYNPTTGEIGYK